VSSKTNIKVLYNPFDTSRFNVNNNKTTDIDRLKICYTGRLAKGKNLNRWIDTAFDLLKTYPGFEFNIYGDGAQKNELESLIREKNLQAKIILHGFRKDVENVYRENDLLLFLSEYESFGNVVVESILCGMPVIASKIPAMEEIFKDYPEFLVNLDEDLTKNIRAKISQYPMLKESAQRAAKEFREKYSLEKHINELEKIYKSFE
jgi:glycosyltransferase involved in cell wall biosynthesis